MNVYGTIEGDVLLRKGASIFVDSGARTGKIVSTKRAKDISIYGCVPELEIDEPKDTTLKMDGLKAECAVPMKLEINKGTMAAFEISNALLYEVKLDGVTLTAPYSMMNCQIAGEVDIEEPSCNPGAYIEVVGSTIDGDLKIEGIENSADEEDRRRLSVLEDACPVILSYVSTSMDVKVENVASIDITTLHADKLDIEHVHGGKVVSSTIADEVEFEECIGTLTKPFLIEGNCFYGDVEVEDSDYITATKNMFLGDFECEDNAMFMDGGGNAGSGDCDSIAFDDVDPNAMCSCSNGL